MPDVPEFSELSDEEVFSLLDHDPEAERLLVEIEKALVDLRELARA